MRALLSVTDKTGLLDIAQGLHRLGYEIVSTGGTAKLLREADLPVTDASEVTGFPEMLEGRIKTLHPMIHGGLLGDLRSEDHKAQMEQANIKPIALAIVNLYAFEKTVNAPHTLDEAIESIDIGGPAMIRAAAKNHASVAVVVDPNDYREVLARLADGTLDEMKMKLAAKAFRHTAFYDSMISRYLSNAAGEPDLTETLTLGMRRRQILRYGENPHQTAAVYQDPLSKGGIARAVQIGGKELSYNNFLDSDGAWELVCDMPAGSVAIIKHGNPCGAASCGNFPDSYREARASDPISAFGGIAACNGVIDLATAEAMTEKGNFLEVVIGTEFTAEAQEVFQNRSGWGANVRLLEADLSEEKSYLTCRTIRGGALVQDSDEHPESSWQLVTERQPTDEEMKALVLAWSLIPHVKSNGIVVANATKLLGVGAGQMNRVQSVRLALEQAGEAANGAVLASDAFFPFPDSIETGAAAGIKAFIQPGGSKKDEEVIAAADRLNVSIIMTGVRHFRH